MELRRSVQLATWPMTVIGVNPLKPDTFWQCYIRLFLFSGFITYGVCGLLSYTYCSEVNFYDLAVPMSYAFSASLFAINAVYLQKHKPILRDLLLSINDVFKYDDAEDFDEGHQLDRIQDERFVRLHKRISIYSITQYVIFSATPLIGYLVTGEWRTTMYLQCIPSQMDSVMPVVLTHFAQFFVVSCGFIMMSLNMLFYLFIVTEFDREFGRLQYAIETLNKRTWRAVLQLRAGRVAKSSSSVSANQSDDFNEIFRRNFIACVRHYQKIYKMYQRSKVYSEFDFKGQLLTAGSLTSVSLYGIIGETNLGRFFSFISAMAMIVMNMFIRCYVGEQISAMNERIQNALFYETDCHLQSVKNKKLIVIFHGLVARPLQLKGFGTLTSSFNLFYGFIKVSYTYFNLLRSSMK